MVNKLRKIYVSEWMNVKYNFSIDPLVADEIYTVNLMGDAVFPINDAAGNAFSSYSWEFKTDPIP